MAVLSAKVARMVFSECRISDVKMLKNVEGKITSLIREVDLREFVLTTNSRETI